MYSRQPVKAPSQSEPINPLKAATRVWEDHQALFTGSHVSSELTGLSQSTSVKGRPLTNSPRDRLDGPHVCVYLSVSQGSESRATSNPLKATIRNQERRRAPASGQRRPSESSALNHLSCAATVSRVHDYTPVLPASGPTPAGTGARKCVPGRF